MAVLKSIEAQDTGLPDVVLEKKIRTYEFPEEDNFLRKSNLIENLLICYNLPEAVKSLTDMAFEAVDTDDSNSLDSDELYDVLNEVST